MLAIRLARFGSKKKPSYRIVVIEKDRARDSKAVEVLGHYDPLMEPAKVVLDHSRFEHWVRVGAQPSDTVARLVRANPAPVPVAV